jgi:hypothetical protein
VLATTGAHLLLGLLAALAAVAAGAALVHAHRGSRGPAVRGRP